MKKSFVLLTFAVHEEARPFQKLIGAPSGFRVLLTGIGPGNAEKTVRKALAELSPHLVLTCGFAGGLNPELPAGTVIFSVDDDSTAATDPTTLTSLNEEGIASNSPVPVPLREGSVAASSAQQLASQPRLLAAVLKRGGARRGKFHCADRIVGTVEEKRALRQATGADAVEMESGVIRAICRDHKIAGATVRVISDAANEELPLDFNQLMDADQKLNRGRLTLALLKDPRNIGALFRFQKQARNAAEKLAQGHP